MYSATNGVALGATNLDRLNLDDGHPLKRSISFLSIQDPLTDISQLLDLRNECHLPRLDAETSEVLNEIVRTVKLNGEAVSAAAVSDAQAGKRVLPMTLDPKKFGNFLARNEPILRTVISACHNVQGRRDTLQSCLQILANDYFQTQNRVPNGLAPNTRILLDGQVITGEPITVLVGATAKGIGEYRHQPAGTDGKIIIDIGHDIVYGSILPDAVLTQGFEKHDPAHRRAAAVLQSFFRCATMLEEQVAALGSHFNKARGTEAQQAKATRVELQYTGDRGIGDSCLEDGQNYNQRALSTREFNLLPKVAEIYEADHQAPLLTDPSLQTWLQSRDFNVDMLATTKPATRLCDAQVSSTSTALLATRAFAM